MAALRDIARDFATEIRDGIGWTIVYRTGRSWNALTIWSDIWNGEWETNDLNDAIGILKADPDAVIVNGYYCGHFGEDMTIDEIAAGIRWHYEGGRNRLADYCEVTQGRDALEEGRKAAEAAGLPFCERLADGGDDELSPYVYDGSMTLADREKMQQAREAFEKLADALREIAAKLAEAMKPVINAVLSALKKLWKVSAKAIGVPPKWLHLAAHAKKPEPGRSTATASGAMFSRLWLRKEVEAHDSQVRRLRARLERQHLPEDPPHRLHLPAL